MYKRSFASGFLFSMLITIFVLGCTKFKNEEKNADQIESQQKNIITVQDAESISITEYALSDMADKQIESWLKFHTLLTEMEQLKKGNLTFFIDDKALLSGFLNDLRNETPKTYNVTSINVRLSVFETTVYRLEEASKLDGTTKDQILSYIKEVLVAYNNLILQINKLTEKNSQNITKPL